MNRSVAFRFLLVIAFCASLTTGCARAPIASPYWADQADTFHRIVADLADPALEGRDAGSAGIDKARDYLAQQFDAIGLQPAVRATDGHRFTQAFSVHLGVKAVEQALAVAPGAGEPFGPELEPGVDFNALGLSADGKFDGQAVFVGYGVVNDERQYNSYAALHGESLAGKVAVAFRYEPVDGKRRSRWASSGSADYGRWSGAALFSAKAQQAAGHGASALLIVNPPSHDAGTKLRSTRSTSGATAAVPVMQISSRLFERMLASDGENAAGRVEQLQRRANKGESTIVPLGRVRGGVRLERPEAGVANVAALLPGVGALADQVIVVGAHYDHIGYGEIGSRTEARVIHPGADDNASGTAGLLLLARAAAQRADDAQPPAARRAVLFVAFAAEERGLLGSAHFVDHTADLGVAQEQIVAMLNMDMIGRLEKNRLYVFGVGSGDKWTRLVRAANRRIGLRLKFDGSAMGASDHTSFYTRKIPALHFFTGVHTDYHNPTDTADKINGAGAAMVLQLIDSLIEDLAGRPQSPAFVADRSASRPTGAVTSDPGGGARLGVMPDYATMHGDRGCGVQAVSPAGPAADAGLQAGDVIIRWNDRVVGNVYDLQEALNDSDPGQTVQLRLRRRGKTITLAVTLGSK